MRAGKVIAKLAEDAYFMRVDNRVTQVPPLRIRESDNHEATSRSPVNNGRNRTRGELLQNPNCTRAEAGGPSQGGTVPAAPAVVAVPLLMVMLVAEAVAAGATHTGLAGEPVAEATAEAEATRTATSPLPHAVAMMPAVELKKFDAKSPPRQVTTTASPPSLIGFAICFSWRNSNPWDHQVRHEARSSPVAQMLRHLHQKRWWQQ
jgi:hypothetical protein